MATALRWGLSASAALAWGLADAGFARGSLGKALKRKEVQQNGQRNHQKRLIALAARIVLGKDIL